MTWLIPAALTVLALVWALFWRLGSSTEDYVATLIRLGLVAIVVPTVWCVYFAVRAFVG